MTTIETKTEERTNLTIKTNHQARITTRIEETTGTTIRKTNRTHEIAILSGTANVNLNPNRLHPAAVGL
jgi:hypothetical protein